MKLSMPVSLFKSTLKSLAGICNPKAVEPVYRYVGVSVEDGVVRFVACNADMLGVQRFSGHPDVEVDSKKGDNTLLLDSIHFNQLVDTFNPDQMISFENGEKGKSVRVKCGKHESENQFSFRVKFEDFHRESDYGNEVPAADVASDEWDRFPLDLSPLIKQVDTCMPKSDLQTADHWLSAIRLTTTSEKDGGTWVQIHATDSFRFAHFRYKDEGSLPEADLLIDYTIVNQMTRLGFSHMFVNDKSFAFTGGESGVTLYCRRLGDVSKFPNLDKIFDNFRKREKLEVLKTGTEEFTHLLKRQCLFADQIDTTLYSKLKVDSEAQELVWAATNKLMRGDDSIKFEPVCGDIKDRELVVNPQALQSYVEKNGYRDLHIMVVPQGAKKCLVALCPDADNYEEGRGEEGGEDQKAGGKKKVKAKDKDSGKRKKSEGDEKEEPSGEFGESEEVVEKAPRLLGVLAHSEFVFVTGARVSK